MKSKILLLFSAIFLTISLQAQNSITPVTFPTTVNASSNVDITFDYTKEASVANAHIYIRLKDENGNISDVNKIVSDNSGTLTLSLPIPDVTIGSNYFYQVQMFLLPGYSNVGVSKDLPDAVTVEAALPPPPPPNTITLVNPPTTVLAERNVDITFNYTKDVPNAHIFIRFKGNTGNLTEVNQKITENSGTLTLSLPIPDVPAGDNYTIQTQMFNLPGYSNLVSENLNGITVEVYQPTGINELEIVDTLSDPINNGTLRPVNINYNLLQSSRILVEVYDKEQVSGSKKIGEAWVDLPASKGSVTIDLIVDQGFPGTTNRIQASLHESGSNSTSISIPETPFLLVGKGDGTITYREQPFTGAGTQNGFFTQGLDEGYYTNYYIANGWKGPLKMKFGKAGTPSWIEYENQNVISDNHKEFDIKIQKFSWHEDKDFFNDRGYPTVLKDINKQLVATLEGQWSPGSKGKGQINMTAWVTETGDMAGKRIDIIVHAFDNGGNFRKKYDDELGRFRNIGELTSTNGYTYQILRSLPGFLGEVASYNLVPDALVQADPRADYSNEVITSTIDMKEILDGLIAKEEAYTGSQGKVDFNENWFVNGLEWTVVGQSGNIDTDGKMIPNGRGKFTFNSYTIPNLSALALSTGDVHLNDKNVTIYPNPFTDSFTFKFDGEYNEPINVEIFTIDGKKVKTNYSNLSLNNRTVSTSHLSEGVYIVHITFGDVQETRRLIKN